MQPRARQGSCTVLGVRDNQLLVMASWSVWTQRRPDDADAVHRAEHCHHAGANGCQTSGQFQLAIEERGSGNSDRFTSPFSRPGQTIDITVSSIVRQKSARRHAVDDAAERCGWSVYAMRRQHAGERAERLRAVPRPGESFERWRIPAGDSGAFRADGIGSG